MLKIVVDASLVNHKTTGIGNVTQALVSGLEMQSESSVQFNFLVPSDYQPRKQQTENNAIYSPTAKWQKYFPKSLPLADIWHSTYQSFRYLRKTTTTKHIITIHDLNFIYEKSALKAKKYLRKLQKKVNKADVLVAISEFVAQDIRNHLEISGKQLEVIYNSVDNLQNIEPCKPEFFRDGIPFFFTLGAVRRKKNFHVLIDMMQKFPNYNLYICGNKDDVAYSNEMELRIKKLGLENVILTGPITTQEKVWLYRKTDAFLFPSLFEGFGLPVLEAMQFGKPVFISNMTSLPEVSGGYAFIWENFDPNYLSQTIIENLPIMQQDHNKTEHMREYALSFTQERNINAYMRLYQKTANIISLPKA